MGFCKSRRFFGQKTSLICMLSMTGTFFVVEITVGYMTNSTSLVADSFHMLSDILSLVIGFLAVVFSKKDSRYNTYGWARAEVLGALANSVFLFALCFSIFVSGIQRIVQIEKVEDPLYIIYVGSAGLAINLVGLVLFHGHSHGHHHHDHDHGHHHHHNHNHGRGSDQREAIFKPELDAQKVKEVSHSSDGQLNMKGVFLHVLGDALGSIVVLISALTIYFAKGDWKYYMDPIMSLVIATIVIFTTWPLLKRSSYILLQNPPPHINIDDLSLELLKIHGVQAVHDFHVWQLSGNVVIASAHVTMHREDSFNETAQKVRKMFHDNGIHSLTLQPEFYDCSEGQSLCGADGCYYLKQSNAQQDGDVIVNGETTNAEQGYQERSQDSICLLPCVSTSCEEYQCCLNVNKSKVKSSSENVANSRGLENPCYQEENSSSNFPGYDVANTDELTSKAATLPRCNNKHHRDYSIV